MRFKLCAIRRGELRVRILDPYGLGDRVVLDVTAVHAHREFREIRLRVLEFLKPIHRQWKRDPCREILICTVLEDIGHPGQVLADAEVICPC